LTIEMRSELVEFAVEMEMVLKKHDHKQSWRELPVMALVRKLELELAEFHVAYDHLTVGEARKELVDIANFAMFVWDRLRMLDQDRTIPEQRREAS
jgi:hypothetical protein